MAKKIEPEFDDKVKEMLDGIELQKQERLAHDMSQLKNPTKCCESLWSSSYFWSSPKYSMRALW